MFYFARTELAARDVAIHDVLTSIMIMSFKQYCSPRPKLACDAERLASLNDWTQKFLFLFYTHRACCARCCNPRHTDQHNDHEFQVGIDPQNAHPQQSKVQGFRQKRLHRLRVRHGFYFATAELAARDVAIHDRLTSIILGKDFW